MIAEFPAAATTYRGAVRSRKGPKFSTACSSQEYPRVSLVLSEEVRDSLR